MVGGWEIFIVRVEAKYQLEMAAIRTVFVLERREKNHFKGNRLYYPLALVRNVHGGFEPVPAGEHRVGNLQNLVLAAIWRVFMLQR